MSAIVSAVSAQSPMTIRRVGAFLGAEITGIDLAQPLDESTASALRRAHAEHGVLVFPDQILTSEQFMAFARHFGTLSVHPFSSSTRERPELIVYDNKEANPPGATDVWHTDETFRASPPMGTMLYSKIVPEVGGDTAFVSMNAIYEGLSPKLQSLLSGLEAVHDFRPFKELFPKTPEGRERLRTYEEMYPPIAHPMVAEHPTTGKKVLFVNPLFTLYIKHMAEDESRTLLDLLYRKTYVHEYQYRHRWKPNMVVFWDNRWTQHSALHDYYPHRRLMERVTIQGTSPVPAGPACDAAEVRRYLMPPITAFDHVRQKRQHEL